MKRQRRSEEILRDREDQRKKIRDGEDQRRCEEIQYWWAVLLCRCIVSIHIQQARYTVLVNITIMLVYCIYTGGKRYSIGVQYYYVVVLYHRRQDLQYWGRVPLYSCTCTVSIRVYRQQARDKVLLDSTPT